MEEITVIKPAFELFEKTVGRSLAKAQGPYRWCDYIVRTECEEGLLLWSTLSGALILVPPTGAKIIAQGDQIPEGCGNPGLGDPTHSAPCRGATQTTLLSLGFLVPESFDEWKASEELRSLCGLMGKKEHREWGFTVFTTLACNARCPYCFEKGMAEEVIRNQNPESRNQSLHMSKSTAEAVADFIADKAMADGYGHGSHPDGKAIAIGHSHSQSAPMVRLSWFGGEPMMNVGAIETICGGLERRGVAWRSEMTTNGVLFDRALARHAVERWRLEGAQVTLDGREGEYNRVKGIRLSGGESAYGRVMRNIGWLAEAGVRVTVRLNLSLENAAELMLLAEELQPLSGVDVYAMPLYEYFQPSRDRQAAEVFALYRALADRLQRRGLLLPGGLPKPMRLNHCMADNDRAFGILPDGRLDKCRDTQAMVTVGDIFGSPMDTRRIAQFKRPQKNPGRCRRCPLAPQCTFLEACAVKCSELYLLRQNDLISRPMLAEYLRWRRGEGEGEENLFACV